MSAIQNTKNCTLCGKPVGSDHYASVASRHRGCHKAAARKNRADNLERVQKYDRDRFQNDPARRAKQLASMRANYDLQAAIEANRKYREKNKEKLIAHCAINNAIRDGRVTAKTECEICNEVASHAHHHDYSKPLDVWWLCGECHRYLHRLLRSVARKSITTLSIKEK